METTSTETNPLSEISKHIKTDITLTTISSLDTLHKVLIPQQEQQLKLFTFQKKKRLNEKTYNPLAKFSTM